MRNSKMNFGENLQKLRKEKNISQEQLAEELNVSRQTIGKWENGVTYPETECLIQISDFFEVSIDTMLRGTVTDSNVVESASGDEAALQQAKQQLKSSTNTAQRNRRIRTVIAIILFIISPFYPGEPGANSINAFLMILSIAVGIGLLIYNHMTKDQAG